MSSDNGGPLVEIDDLRVWFKVTSGIVLDRHVGDVKAVDGVSFVDRARRDASASSASRAAGSRRSDARSSVSIKPTSGRIVFDGQDITKLSESELHPVRRRMQMVFQDPYASLNPRHSVGRIVARAAARTRHRDARRGGRERCPAPRAWSGSPPMPRTGTRTSSPAASASGSASPVPSRCNPAFIVCDEPVSALDVSIQAQIVNLLEDLAARVSSHVSLHRARPRRRTAYLDTDHRDVSREDRRGRSRRRPVREPIAPVHRHVALGRSRSPTPRSNGTVARSV